MLCSLVSVFLYLDAFPRFIGASVPLEQHQLFVPYQQIAQCGLSLLSVLLGSFTYANQ